MEKLAPIVLFTYNRPFHTRETLEALSKNELADKSILYIFSDGPKNNATQQELDNVYKTRSIVKKEKWCKEVHHIVQENNIGLADSIVNGVTQIINKHGKIIVLEDDIVTSKYFLKFMNESLLELENETEVISISGYIYPIENLPNMFFIKGADCWGWATWKRGWKLFEPDGSKLLKKLEEKNLANEFDMEGNYPFKNMLQDQINKKNNSWAIRWYASAFLNNKYTLYPGKSFVFNIGNDGSGTHGKNSKSFDSTFTHNSLKLEIPKIEQNSFAYRKIGLFLKRTRQPTKTTNDNKIVSRLGQSLKKLICFKYMYK